MRYYFLALALFASPALADAESHKQTAMRLLEATNIDAQLQSIAVSLRDNQARQLARMNLPPAAQPLVQEYLGKTLDLMVSAFSKPELHSAYAETFVEVFTEQELQDALNFFESSAGKKYLDKQSELRAALVPLVQKELAVIQPQLLELQNNLRATLQQLQQ